jgi:aerobic-type carbon monoxide dehydrogenase small subunit (CoxS/CutS family)
VSDNPPEVPRAAARFSVNGMEVSLSVAPRTTLADALREHVGLTGTHLGCEHGVCGMCTVLVDGAAVRSCLLFACQLDGAEVLTIEGLGRPDRLHPIQQAFCDNHGLQCGFCTPAFVLSAYELLQDHPTLEGIDLPVELSGILWCGRWPPAIQTGSPRPGTSPPVAPSAGGRPTGPDRTGMPAAQNAMTSRPRTPPASRRRCASAARSGGSVSATRRVRPPRLARSLRACRAAWLPA